MAGIIHNDRELGARVRRLTLRKIEAVLKGDDEEFKKAVILKLSSSILPRLNEVTGEGGEPMKITIEVAGEVAKKNNLYGNEEVPKV